MTHVFQLAGLLLEEFVGVVVVVGHARAESVDQGEASVLQPSFDQLDQLPLLAIVSRRGGLGEYNSMIHRFCEHVEPILQAADLRYFALDERVPAERWADWLVKADEFARITRRPVFLLVNLMAE